MFSFPSASAANLPKETRFASDIQRLFRGGKSRTRIRGKHFAANEIQRVFRGHRGRKRVKDAARVRAQMQRYHLIQYFVLQIQRVLRGFYSRKYRSNHASRKRFIKATKEKAEEIRGMLNNYAIRQNQAADQEKMEYRSREIEMCAEKLHHLLSTKRVRGVFNPPEDLIETPTLNNVPVEDHVRGFVKDLLRTKGITKKELVLDMNGTKKVPYKGLKNRLSLQASAPYDSLEKEKQHERILHKVLTKGKGNWFAGGKVKLLNKDSKPLNSGDPYFDPWSNPMLVRGVPESQQQFNEAAWTRLPLFNKPVEKAFYSRTGGNKSAVMPNDLFEVIAEAEETGGVLHRNLGTSRRFGVPDCCDNRPSGVLPAPPPRASTLRPTHPKMNTYKVLQKPKELLKEEMGEPKDVKEKTVETEDLNYDDDYEGGEYKHREEKKREYPYDSSDEES